MASGVSLACALRKAGAQDHEFEPSKVGIVSLAANGTVELAIVQA
jgi:hypothetical protein